MKDARTALAWIVTEMNTRKIPYAVCGGLAANAYGTSRPLNDIDIDVPDWALPVLAKELNAYVQFGPERSISECFDCQLLGLSYLGQEIELSGAESLRVRNVTKQIWNSLPTDLLDVETVHFFGIEFQAMKRSKLLAYKKLAGRDTDLVDVKEMEARTNRDFWSIE